MKIIKFVIWALMSISCLAYSQINVKVSSRDVVVDEPFSVLISVMTTSNEEPNISFNPIGLEVLGRENHGVSTRTVYMNGRISVSREITYAYEMVGHRVGFAQIKDIKAEINGQVFNHPYISLNVRREPIEKADIFLEASIDKENAYVGEGITVNYYLYRKLDASGFEIKKFPKLNGFFKRFVQEVDRTERVEYDGEIYIRSPIYATYIFPEKPGQLTIDSLDLKISYVEGGGSPFGLGFGIRGIKTKTLSSKAKTVNVIPLPVEGLPEGFTGLVGKHSFKLEQNKTKFLANEPIELTLTIEGNGALEKMENPGIIQDKLLEEFEANSEFVNVDAKVAKKTIKYTFLGRGALTLPPKKLSMSYFDTQEKKYVQVNLDFKGLEVSGSMSGAVKPESTDALDEEKENPIEKIFSTEDSKGDLQSSIIGFNFDLTSRPILKYLFWIFCAGMAFLLIFIQLDGQLKFNSGKDGIEAQLLKAGANFESLYKLLSALDHGEGLKVGLSKSDLSTGAKNYFMQLLDEVEKNQFSGKKENKKITVSKKYLDEYLKMVKSDRNKK